MYHHIWKSPIEWAGKTAPEVCDVADREGSILVVPVGGLEQHGEAFFEAFADGFADLLRDVHVEHAP